MATDTITCDVCDIVISKSRFSNHRMSLNCKCTANIQLYVKDNSFDLDIDNMVGQKMKCFMVNLRAALNLQIMKEGKIFNHVIQCITHLKTL